MADGTLRRITERLEQAGIDPAASGGEPPEFDLIAFRTEQARAVLDRVVPVRFAEAKPDHPEVAEWVAGYLAAPTEAPSLLISGPTGTGKTWQCWGTVRAAAEGMATVGRRLDWRATTHPALNAELRPQADNSHATALDAYLEADLLMLDDLGAGRQTEWTADTLFRLIDHRWANRKTSIYSTNLTPDALTDAVGERVVSRLIDAVRVAIKGADRRRVAQRG